MSEYVEVINRRWGAVHLLGIFLAVLLGSGCGGGSRTGGGGGDSTDAPVILSVTPDKGHVTGGEHVIISGTGFTFTSDTTVYFGTTLAGDVSVLNSTTITCVTPAYDPGTVDVTVENSNGSDILVNGFTFQTDVPSILWFSYEKDRNQVDFTWELSGSGDKIVFFRGSEAVAVLPGDADYFHYEEQYIGLYRYTVALYVGNMRVDQRDVLIHMARVFWDPPASGDYSGFYLYVAEAGTGDPYDLLPYNDPSKFSYDAGMNNEVDLMALYLNNLIKGETRYYLAASTYLISGPDTFISNLTDPIEFYCSVSMTEP